MFFPVYAALAIALVFYLGIPLVGAFMLRGQWRRFRARLAELARAPILRYGDVAAARAAGDLVVGRFRLYGRVEALEGSDRVWLRGEGVSAVIDLAQAPLYSLSSGEGGPPSVARLPWESVTSLAEGTSLFAAGLVVLDGGNPVFAEAPGESLLVVSHDCPDAELAARLVEGGRAPNEYWTPLSQVSLALGIALMSATLVAFWGRSSFSTVRAMSFLIGVSPVLILVPPGLFLFLLYRLLWRRALSLRVARDAYRMPLSFFPEGPGQGIAILPDGGRYVARPLAAGEEPPPGALVLEAPRDSDRWGGTWIFFAEGSRDPAAMTIATPGEPFKLAASAAREADIAALGAGLAFAAGLFLNYVAGIVLWRSFF